MSTETQPASANLVIGLETKGLKSCKVCIHNKVCVAFRAAIAIKADFDEKFDFAKLPMVPEALAIQCDSFLRPQA